MRTSPRHLLSVGDLTDGEVRGILDRAGVLERSGSFEDHALPGGPLVGLLFLSSSLRTRVGFAAAAARLGGTFVEVRDDRFTTEMSNPESFGDQLRTLSGLVDVVVARVPFPLAPVAREWSTVPTVNGGDSPRGEHPSQALIDLFAMERERGPLAGLCVAVVGDLTMRSTRSSLALMARTPPRELRLIAPPVRRAHGIDLGTVLDARTTVTDELDLSGVDVVHMAGLPRGQGDRALGHADRRRYSLDSEVLRSLPDDAVVLSPLPIIDEVCDEVRYDPRMAFHRQSDRSLFVRMALLEHLLADVRLPGTAPVDRRRRP